LKQTEADVNKALGKSAYEVKIKAPGVFGSNAPKVYNIKKKDILASFKGTADSKPKIKIRGDIITGYRLVFQGQRQSPQKFSMNPTAPTGGSYTLKMKVFKAEGKKTIGRYKKNKKAGGPYSKQSHNILMPIHKKGETGYIPFQRMSEKRGDLKPFRTLAIPQMITNPEVLEPSLEEIQAFLNKRLQHIIDRIVHKK